MTTLFLSPLPVLQWFADDGSPLASGKVYTYAAGSSTLLATYSDNAALHPHTNPILLDATGKATIYLSPVAYKFDVQDANGVSIEGYPQDYIQGSEQTPAGFTSVKDFGAVGDGIVNDTAAIQSSVNAGRLIWFPPGTYKITTTITVPNGRTLAGADRSSTFVSYTGTGDAFLNQNPVNGSGYGQVAFRDFTILGIDTASQVGAGIDLQAGGFAYYTLERMRVAGFLYPLVLDQVEVSQIESSIFESSQQLGACIWLTNGAEWRAGSGGGFTNVITINGCQLNGAVCGIRDDGGNAHTMSGSNFNGQAFQIRAAAVQSLKITGNSFESALVTGLFNIAIIDTGGASGLAKGPCLNGIIEGNTFAGNMASPGNLLSFLGGSFHTGFHVAGNYFLSTLGRGAAINVEKLATSVCVGNYDSGIAGMFHYNNLHEDASGNVLYPPQNGALVSDATTQLYEFGDTSRRARFYGSLQTPFLMTNASSVLTVSSNTIAPTGSTHHVGAGLIKTITVPSAVAAPWVLTIIPDAAFTYDATGNIGAVIGGTATVGRPMTFSWDGTKFWASY